MSPNRKQETGNYDHGGTRTDIQSLLFYNKNLRSIRHLKQSKPSPQLLHGSTDLFLSCIFNHFFSKKFESS